MHMVNVSGWGMAIALGTLLTSLPSGAQTSPSGQVVAPGSVSRRTAAAPCNGTETPSSAANATDPNCVEAAPGFGTPALDAKKVDRPRNVVALVRVDAVIPRPPVAMPEGDTFSVVGSATLVRVRRPELADCLATGKRISVRANASTATTCLDRKGELLAYEECRLSSECAVLTPEDIARQQGSGGKTQ